MSRPVIIDANRIFSELIAGRRLLKALRSTHPEVMLYCPKYVFVELFKHKERIAAATSLSEDDLLATLHTCLQYLHFFDEDAISIGSWTEAWRLCRDVDENDVAYIALTLELDGLLWSSDKKLEQGLKKKGFDRFFVVE